MTTGEYLSEATRSRADIMLDACNNGPAKDAINALIEMVLAQVGEPDAEVQAILSTGNAHDQAIELMATGIVTGCTGLAALGRQPVTMTPIGAALLLALTKALAGDATIGCLRAAAITDYLKRLP